MSDDAISDAEPIEIPIDRLSGEALQGLIEEYITREGTNYGHREFSLEEKVAQVRRQLDSGQAVIVYDPDLETFTLRGKEA